MRLDKWLWHARIYKTRTLATDMVSRGKVRVNGDRTKKASRAVAPGDVLTLVQGREIRVLKITGLPERRGPASEAQAHYDAIEGED